MPSDWKKRDVRHPDAGKWGRSAWLWHYLQWVESGDGSATDGGSLCGRYIGPPYAGVPPLLHKCAKCAKLAD